MGNKNSKNLSSVEIYKWLSSKNYQIEKDDTGEYNLYYEIDIPKIIIEFINEFDCCTSL